MSHRGTFVADLKRIFPWLCFSGNSWADEHYRPLPAGNMSLHVWNDHRCLNLLSCTSLSDMITLPKHAASFKYCCFDFKFHDLQTLPRQLQGSLGWRQRKANCWVVSRRLSLGQKAALELATKSTANSQLAQDCSYLNHCYDETEFSYHFCQHGYLLLRISLIKSCKWHRHYQPMVFFGCGRRAGGENCTKIGEIMNQGSFPFYFCFPSCALIHLAEQPISVLLPPADSTTDSTCSDWAWAAKTKARVAPGSLSIGWRPTVGLVFRFF